MGAPPHVGNPLAALPLSQPFGEMTAYDQRLTVSATLTRPSRSLRSLPVWNGLGHLRRLDVRFCKVARGATS